MDRVWVHSDGMTGFEVVARVILRTRKFIAQRVLHTSDTPHQVALGVGAATFVAMLPIPGLQTVVAIAAAALLRANKAVCVPVVWLTNPVTMGPIYASCYALGRFILRGGPPAADAAPDVEHVVSLHLGGHPGWGHVLEIGFWRDLSGVLLDFGADLWVGCLAVGVVSAVASYVLARWGVSAFREHHRRRVLRRSLFRAQLKQAKVTRTSEPA